MEQGPYVKDEEEFDRILREMYDEHPPITLSSEYAFFIEKDMMTLLIRLARYKFVARHLKADDRVLEVGCGSGLGSIFLAQHCAQVTGLEVTGYEIEDALRHNRRDNVTFLQQDFFDYAEDEKVDAVILLDVIEHLEEPDGRRMIEKTARHLKPEGMLVVGTPSLYSYDYQSPASRAGHVKCYDQRELTDMIEATYGRAVAFSMNDEMVHTGYPKLAWYYFVLAFLPGGAPVP